MVLYVTDCAKVTPSLNVMVPPGINELILAKHISLTLILPLKLESPIEINLPCIVTLSDKSIFDISLIIIFL